MDELTDLIKSLHSLTETIIHRDFQDLKKQLDAIRLELIEIKMEQNEQKEVLKSLAFDLIKNKYAR